jgi:hypothetical protein
MVPAPDGSTMQLVGVASGCNDGPALPFLDPTVVAAVAAAVCGCTDAAVGFSPKAVVQTSGVWDVPVWVTGPGGGIGETTVQSIASSVTEAANGFSVYSSTDLGNYVTHDESGGSCASVASAWVSGMALAAFNGFYNEISVILTDSHTYANLIARDGPVSGSGSVKASTCVMTEEVAPVRTVIPFVVTGTTQRNTLSGSINRYRTGSGSFASSSTLTWTIRADANGNGSIDQDVDITLATGTVDMPAGEIANFSIPLSVPLHADNYTLEVTLRTFQARESVSEDCGVSVNESASTSQWIDMELFIN